MCVHTLCEGGHFPAMIGSTHRTQGTENAFCSPLWNMNDLANFYSWLGNPQSLWGLKSIKMNNRRNGCRRVQYLFCNKMKWDWLYDFSVVQVLFLCVQFCFGLVRNSTSPRKNAGIAGYFILYQSVVLFLEMFVFDVFQKVANLCVCGCNA